LKDALPADSRRQRLYDQRPYKTLTVMPPKTTPGGQRRCRRQPLSTSAVEPDRWTSAAMLGEARRTRVAPSRGSTALRRDAAHRSARTTSPSWRCGPISRRSIRHAAAAHTKQYRDDVQPVAGSPLDERAFRRIEWTSLQ
jgi:hypothetical protein